MPRGTQGRIQSLTTFAYEGLTPFAHAFQRVRLAVEFVTLSSRCYDSGAPVNPHPATHAGYHTEWVWAFPISLATTLGILLFSWGYLDVSVPPVPSYWPMCSTSGDRVLLGRVPPFGYLRFDV